MSLDISRWYDIFMPLVIVLIVGGGFIIAAIAAVKAFLRGLRQELNTRK